MMLQCWIGIDVGTHGIRGVALKDTLELVAEATADIPTYFPGAGWAIQRPGDLQEALNNVMRRLSVQIHTLGYQIQGIGFDGTASLMLVTSHLEPLSDVILWMDLRAHQEAQIISRFTGVAESAELPWAKAVWIVNHSTEDLRNTFLVEADEWLCSLLTGQSFRGRTNAILKWHGQGEMALPVWAREFPQVVERLPERICSLNTPVGNLRQEWCEAWGIANTVVIMPPIIDAYAAAIGVGAVRPGTMALIMGTSACELFHGTFRGSVAGLWGPYSDPYECGVDVLEAGQPSVGSVVDWIWRLTSPTLSMEEFDMQAGGIAPGSNGMRFSPAFQGIRSPWPDASAQGQMRGLGLEHTGAHMLRACYEATACDIKRIFDVIPVNERSQQVIVTGGASQSPVWMQIIADVCELPIDIADSRATPRGAAMLAMGSDFETSTNTSILSHIEPGEHRLFYQGFYEDYCSLFPLRRG